MKAEAAAVKPPTRSLRVEDNDRSQLSLVRGLGDERVCGLVVVHFTAVKIYEQKGVVVCVELTCHIPSRRSVTQIFPVIRRST